KDGIGLAQDGHALGGQFANATDGQAGTREGMQMQDFRVDAKQGADLADLVFEKRTQRLDELYRNVEGKAADVMVALDGLGARQVVVRRFDDIGIYGALGQVGEALAADVGGEALDEQPADE